jgi:hypothetical protein
LVTAQIVVEVDLSTETMEIWNPRSLPRRSFSPFDKIGWTARELQKKALTPVLVALKNDAEWRWLRNHADSPWYPTIRLFRQPEIGHWRSVFSAMAEAYAAIQIHASIATIRIRRQSI